MKKYENYLDLLMKQLNGVKGGIENSRVYSDITQMVDDWKAERDYECAKRVFESLVLPTDIIDEPDCKRYIIDVPGYKKENIHVHIDEDILYVDAIADNADVELTYEQNERNMVDRSRCYVLDEEMEEVKAAYKDGVLTIEMKKKKPRVTKVSID
jgi:HSP20 family protein